MLIKNYDYRYLIIVNLIFILSLYIDFLVPSIQHKSEKIKSFYNAVNYTPTWKSGGGSREIKYILECESSNIYYLGKFLPEFGKIVKGKEVEIEQSLILRKVKSIKIDNKVYNISFLSLNLVVYIFLFCVAFNILNIFFTNKFLDIMLPFATVPIYFLGFAYIFAY